jgi:predicted CxxxxCH...CXXCH cytochrome family protein
MILLLVSVFIAASAFAAAPPPTVSILDPRPGTSTVPTIVSLTGTGATPASAFKVQIQVWNDVADITGVAVGYCPSTSDPNTLANFAWVAAGVNANYSCGTNCGVYEATVSGLPAGSYYLLARAVSTADGTGYSSDNRTGNDAKFTYIAVRLANAANKGTGMLLARDSSSQLCLDCHNLATHSSQSTSSGYGNWQISCGECHTPHNTHNIYLVKDAITTPNSGSKNITFYNTTGDATNSYVNSAAGSGTTGVCQVCHTQTKDPTSSNPRWRNTGNSDPAHYQNGGANGTQRCTACHPHTSGFKGSCTMCHGNPPVDDSTLIGSVTTFGATGRATQNPPGPPGAGAHATHVTTKGYGCSTCHTGGGSSGDHNKQTSPALVQIGFNLFSGAYRSGAYDAPAFSNTNYDLANGNAGTTVTKAGPSRACSNIYCHSKGQSASTFTGGNAPNLGAVWEGSMNASCSGCHGNDSGATYTISSGSHTKHVANNNIGCVRCHNATVSGNRTISTQANHVNNLINIALDAVANPLGTATYNTVLSPITKTPGTAYSSCTNISCHNDGRSVWNGTVGVGNTNNWGSLGGCNNCHGQTTYGDYRMAAPLYASTSTVPPGKPNAHDRHVDVRTTPSNEPQCKHCHSTVTGSNTAIDGTTPTNHANGVYNVTAGSTYYDGDNVVGGYTTNVSITYNYTANPTTSTCSNVSCHPTGTAGTKLASSTRWDTGYNCTDCHNINLTNTTGYHHAMNNTTNGYPTLIPDGDATSGTNAASRKCTMCHVDHSIFSPMLNASSPGRSSNLRTDIATAPTGSSGYTNSDYTTGGGICISCHSAERTKSTTSVLAETSSTKTVAVPDTDFSGTSHNYTVASTMTNGGATFNANCTKCHNSKNNEATTFQNSTNKFGAHDNPLRRLLASLGIASPADPEEEDFCYRCHSTTANAAAIGGTTKPAANNDWYGAVTNMSAASQDIYNAFQLGGSTTTYTTTASNVLYLRNVNNANAIPPSTRPGSYKYSSGTYFTNTFNDRDMAPTSGGTSTTTVLASGTVTGNYDRGMQFVSPQIDTAITVPAASNITLNIREQRGTGTATLYTRFTVYKWDGATATRVGTTYAQAGTAISTTATTRSINLAVPAGGFSINPGECLVADVEFYDSTAPTTSINVTYTYSNNTAYNLTLPNTVTYNWRTGTTTTGGSRHNVASYSGLHKPSPTDETLAYISTNKHVDCDDCHNPHAAQAGNHAQNSTTLANVLKGVPGTSVTTWPAQATTATWQTGRNTGVTYNALSTADAEWKICFKCHSYANTNVLNWGGSGSLAWVDTGLEFNPNNQAYHPVVQALPSTANRRLATGALTGGWAPGNVMTCTDCHNTDSASSKGPHGSSVKWMLNPNTTGTKYYNWPYTSSANNGQSTGTLLTGSGSSTAPNGGAIFCLSCHVWSGGGAAHTRSDHTGVQCVSCHIRVPHGGTVPRLLTGPNAPARYKPDGNGGGTVDITGVNRPTSGTIGENDCYTNCGHHNSTGFTYGW